MFGANNNGNAQSNASASTSYGQGNTTETSKVVKDSSNFSPEGPTWVPLKPELLHTINPLDNMNDNKDKIWLPLKLKSTSGATTNSTSLSELQNKSVGQNDSWVESAHFSLGAEGVGAGIGEFSNVVNGQWRGKNGIWYSIENGPHPNQYTGSRLSIARTAEKYNFFGKVFYGIELTVTGYEIFQDFRAKEFLSIGPSMFSAIMGGVGLVSPFGFGISTIYFMSEQVKNNWDNIGDVMRKTDELVEKNEQTAKTGSYRMPIF